MIIWNQKIKKSEDIIKALIDSLNKLSINIDGAVEIFNNGKEQGCVLKLYDKFNPDLDMCYWVYMADDRKTNNEITIVSGKHFNCDKNNMWNGNDLEYSVIKDNNARQMHNMARDFLVEIIKNNYEKIYDAPKI